MLAISIQEDPVIYVRICIALCCVGGLIASLEFLTVLPAFAPRGLYSWLVLRCEQVRRLGLRLQPAGLESFGSTTAVGVLLAVRVAMLALLPFLPVQTTTFAIAACSVCVVTVVFTWRRYIGDDGSDQMTTIVLITVALSAGLGRGTVALALGLWFLAFQACLSYAAAGLAKAFSREWRDGSAIFKIFNTEAYGLRPVAALVRGRPALGLLAAWSVIIVECSFPLVVIAPFPLLVVLLSLGVLFHLLCAVIMGLNSFLWAFAATYPALVFANHSLRGVMNLS